MNFDNKSKAKIILKDENQFIIMVDVNGTYFPSFGVNRAGTFMNTLMVDECEEGKYRRGKNVYHSTKFLECVLSEQIKFSDLKSFLQQNKIVSVPNFCVHSMIVGSDGTTHVVEPGRRNFDNTYFSQGFAVMTNFPLSENVDVNCNEVTGSGADRYKIAHRVILERRKSFDINDGFDVLKQTMQVGEEFPTVLSMLSMPEENSIYFSINRAFNKRYKFSFENNEIRTDIGFAKDNKCILTKKGMSLSELGSWD